MKTKRVTCKTSGDKPKAVEEDRREGHREGSCGAGDVLICCSFVARLSRLSIYHASLARRNDGGCNDRVEEEDGIDSVL